MASNPKSKQLNMRVNPAQRDVIARAAKLRHKTLTEFVIEAATEAAEDVLLKQRLYMASDDQIKELLQVMDSPVSENPALQDTLGKPAPWDQ
jgi:uncharacterized protein (DUF1778 family)